MVAGGTVAVCFDGRILAEYQDVLSRKKFRFDPAELGNLLVQIEAEGEPVLPAPLPHQLPDPRDEAFLEVAIAARADFLVTGNLRHFPPRFRQGVSVVSPRAFLDELRRS